MEQDQGGKSPAYSLADLTALNQEIAALARARLPLDEQLQRLASELPGRSGELSNRLGTRMEQGASLSQALAAEGNNVPEIYRAVVAIGERSGRLPAALEALVESASRLAQLRRATGVALIYPLMVVAIAWLLILFALGSIFPHFAWFEGSRVHPFADSLELPRMAGLATIVAASLVLAALMAWWSSGQRTLSTESRWSVPWLGRVGRLASIATFAELLRLMTEQNVPLDEALELGSRATPNRQLSEAASELARQVSAGRAPTAAGREFPPLIALALKHSGNRPLMVAGFAQAEAIYRERANSTAHWANEYLPILLIVGVGGMSVVALAAVILWPYFSMLKVLSGPFWS